MLLLFAFSPLVKQGKKRLELQRKKLLLLVRMVIIPFVSGTKEKGQKFPPLFTAQVIFAGQKK